MDEVNKILNDYISTHNKNFYFYFINCEFVIEIDYNLQANIKVEDFYNTDINNRNRFLLYDNDCFESRGHKFYNINQMTINIISDRCNMTYEHYITQPMHMFERKTNTNTAKNPQLINSIDRNKNHPLNRDYLHIQFNN